jgi:hypothetical protein
MEESAYVGEGIAGLLYLVVGLRLLQLARRTGRLPERLLTVSFLALGFSYLLYNLPYPLADELLTRLLYSAGRLVAAFGVIAYALFTWCVFRRRDTWGLWAVVGASACLLVGAAGSIWVGDWEGVYPIANPWWWPEWTGATAVEAWLGVEAFVAYGKARHRRALGLSDPLLCNRFLLLGASSVISVALQFVIIVQYIEYEISQHWSATTDVLVSGAEIVTIAMIWLVFCPPRFYRRWINGPASAAKVAKG